MSKKQKHMANYYSDTSLDLQGMTRPKPNQPSQQRQRVLANQMQSRAPGLELLGCIVVSLLLCNLRPIYKIIVLKQAAGDGHCANVSLIS